MWVGTAEMASAVSNAGGLGIITGLTPGSPEALRAEIKKCRSLTNKPFAVNLTFLPSMKPPPYEDYAKVIIEEGIKIAETAGSGMAAPCVKMFKAAGIYVIHKCTTIKHAQSAVKKMGVDMLSIDGFECAGHPGEEDIGGIVLLARAAEELKVPFIASGGFANARGLVSALALGAQGINCGTLFMATTEAPIHQNIKDEIVRCTEADTIHIFRSLGNTARMHKNAIAKEVVRLERRPGGAKFEELAPLVSGARGKKVYETGDVDAGVWTMGISAGLIHDIVPCKVLLERIEREAEEMINRMPKLVVKPRQSKL